MERAIAPRDLVEAVKQHCNLSYVGPLYRRDGECNTAISAAMEPFNYVDIYDIYADVVSCLLCGAPREAPPRRAAAAHGPVHRQPPLRLPQPLDR